MNIAFFVRSMGVGGAERQLCLLCRELVRRGHAVSVLLYYGGEPLEAELLALGVRIRDLKKGGRWSNFGTLLRLIRSVRQQRPDVVYSLLPLPNVLALTLRVLGGGCAVVCGVRASDFSHVKVDWAARFAAVLERRLVHLAHVVIVNSQSGARYLNARRPLRNLVTIDNGIDAQRFRYSESARRCMREAWELPDGASAVGCVARLDPIKDHSTLLNAFALLRRLRPDAWLICIGTQVEPYATQLRALAGDLGIGSCIRWIAHEARMPDAYSALDVMCLTSLSEGFPNVLAEAMACGTPCVATDVGDVRRILSPADVIVPIRNAASLARALDTALSQGRSQSGERVAKIRREFSPELVAMRTEIALNTALCRRHNRTANRPTHGI
jgi:glycosyltransferase involved in cell wall biosynthesis